MSGAIEVKGLRILGTHGVLDEEKVRAQPFEVDLCLECDLAEASRCDDLALTVDYSAVVEAVVRIVEGEHHALLESLAGSIADAVLRDERVLGVEVSVRKLRPPLAYDVSTVGVSMHRERPAPRS